MEKKEPIKISLPLFITIIVLLVAVISGIYVFMQNQKLDKEINNLKEEMKQSQSAKNEIQETLNNNTSKNESQETLNNNNNTSKNELSKKNSESKAEFNDENVKILLEEFLELEQNGYTNNLIEILTEKGELNYDSSKNKILDDKSVLTNVKYDDYKNAMLNYIEESVFEGYWEIWNDSGYCKEYRKDSKGYLIKPKEVEQRYKCRVNNITVDSPLKDGYAIYKADATYFDEKNNYVHDDLFFFSVEYNNGKLLMSSGRMYIE